MSFRALAKNLCETIQTRCRNLQIKQFCLEDIAPAALLIWITHIIIAVLWMLIKILSVVINGKRSHKIIVPGGCHLITDILYAKSTEKSRRCDDFNALS